MYRTNNEQAKLNMEAKVVHRTNNEHAKLNGGESCTGPTMNMPNYIEVKVVQDQ